MELNFTVRISILFVFGSVINDNLTGYDTSPHTFGRCIRFHVGTGIALYGLTGANNSPYTIFVDGIVVQTFTPNSQMVPSTNDTQLLFVRNDLVQGDHTLLIRNNPFASNQLEPTTLDIHHAVVYAASDKSNSGYAR